MTSFNPIRVSVTVEGPEGARRQRLEPDNKARLNEGKKMRGKKGLSSDDVTGALDPTAPEAGLSCGDLRSGVHQPHPCFLEQM